ncbi:hypothetical protein RB597_002607 [Gaeumannomyces tritici]
MSKRTTYTEISPLPSNVTRELVLDFLHNHVEMIDLNPLIKERHPIPVPADAPTDERRCAWYSLTDEISYLPGGIVTGDISYTAAFSDLPNGIQTHCRAPLGVDIRSRWTLNGYLPGEVPERTEIGIKAPAKGLYIREDVELRCNVLMASFVKKTTKRAHMTLVTTLLRKAGKAATDLAATSAGFSTALFAAASPPGVRSHRGSSVGSAPGYTPPRYSPRPSSLNPSHKAGSSTTTATATTCRAHAHSLSDGTGSNGPHRNGHGQCASLGGSPAGTPHRSLSPALGGAWPQPVNADSSYYPAQRRYSPKTLPMSPPQQQPRRSYESENSDVPTLFRPPRAPLGSPPVTGGDWHRASLDSASVPAFFRTPQAPLPSPPVSGGRPRSSSDRSGFGGPDDVPVFFRPPLASLPSPPISGGLPPFSGLGGGGDVPAIFRSPQPPLLSSPPAGSGTHRAYSPPPPTYTPNLMMAPSACSAGNTPAAAVPPSPVSSIGVEDFATTTPKGSSSSGGDETVVISGLGLRTDSGKSGINPFPNPLRISKSNSNASSIYPSSIRLVPQDDDDEHDLDSPQSAARPKSGGFFYPEMNPYEFNDADDDEADSLSAAIDRAARNAADAVETASFTSSVASTPTGRASSPLARQQQQPFFAELEGSEARPEASSPRLMMMRNSAQYDSHPLALRPGSLGASPVNSPLALHEFH